MYNEKYTYPLRYWGLYCRVRRTCAAVKLGYRDLTFPPSPLFPRLLRCPGSHTPYSSPSRSTCLASLCLRTSTYLPKVSFNLTLTCTSIVLVVFVDGLLFHLFHLFSLDPMHCTQMCVKASLLHAKFVFCCFCVHDRVSYHPSIFVIRDKL